MQIVEITDDEGAVVARDWLRKAQFVHRQLRTALRAGYEDKMRAVFAGGGRMCVAVERDEVIGVAVYRTYENTWAGRQLYVDDLVTDEARRSKGVGRALLAHLEAKARAGGLETLCLDSGTQRHEAHRFYFREGMVVTSFHFVKKLA
jgi:GNAT superfamily N-acetyltransferase